VRATQRHVVGPATVHGGHWEHDDESGDGGQVAAGGDAQDGAFAGLPDDRVRRTGVGRTLMARAED